jgi:two-component system, cell cycle sensor histidine kinase and response regulator CckA
MTAPALDGPQSGQRPEPRPEPRPELPRRSSLQAFLLASPDAVFVKDPDGRFSAVNEPGARMLRRSTDEIVGRRDADLLEPEVARRVRLADRDALGSGAVRRSEVTVPTHSGTRTLMTTRTPFHDHTGQLAGLVVVCRDVTTERQVIAQLLHAQKLEAIGQFAGGIVHDFKNVLQVILGCVDFLEAEATPAQYADLWEIVDMCQRGTALAQQLLNLGRRQPSRVSLVDLNAVVAESGAFLRPLIGRVNELVTVLGAAGASVVADAAQLQQVLVNLVVNARDAMPDGGRITIETGIDDVTEDTAPPGLSPGTYVTITVSDTGTGMDATTAALAFDPFFTTKDGGTGLGLATAHAVVNERGGHISLVSTPSKGTRITMHLPLAPHTVTSFHGWAAAQPAEPAEDRGDVFVVADERGVRRLVRRRGEPSFTVFDPPPPSPCD